MKPHDKLTDCRQKAMNTTETQSGSSLQRVVRRRYAASAVLADRKPNGEKIIVHTLVIVMADDENGAMQAARDNATEVYPRAIPFSVRACEVEPANDQAQAQPPTATPERKQKGQ